MKIWRLRAFPKTETGGNKAGVVLDAENLTEQQMQEIAATVGYSETAFVTQGQRSDFRVRFFTPSSEVDLCGHATIATFNLLQLLGHITPGIYRQETNVGILKLEVEKDIVFMEQNTPLFFETIPIDYIEACFEETGWVDSSYPSQVVSTGMKEIFVPVKSIDQLHKLTPKIDKIIALSNQYDTIGMHIFALDDEVDAYGRNFAPIVGIDEESATGTSNGALTCYLHKYVTQKKDYILRQGYSMNLPSEFYGKLTIDNNTITSVWIGGTATIIEEG